ncbi:hypothetical protein PIB30_046631 [Stylosanthes scabra]|uniref:Uncharacterized protein n=1 Tax=Stylosanthes scabra TaxID=79078 RepID=A0ABU6VES1_9FABA|nr:hypothetical protein [Stylosanthes scabra]
MRISNSLKLEPSTHLPNREIEHIIWKKEERKLAEQGMKFGSNSVEESHAYAWMLGHMRTILSRTTPRHPLVKPRHGPYHCLATHRRGKSTRMRGSSSLAKMHPRLDVLLGVALTFSGQAEHQS